MSRKVASTSGHSFSRRERALLVSLLACHCCFTLTSIRALQTQSLQSRSLLSSQSLLSPQTNKGRLKRQELLASSSDSQEHNFQDGIGSSPGMNRREVFSNSAKALFAGIASPFFLDPTDPANAILLRFPVDEYNTQPLKNKYHFMRAGTSELEADGIYSTNSLFLTNRENAMSDTKGYASLKKTLSVLKKTPCQPTVAYHSLAANGMDTGDLIARELKLARDRLLPEFTYLDPRGIGLWDSNSEDVVRPAVWAMDYTEAGNEGFGGRPPANTDGTANDTLHDQFTRLRQFLSLQETRTSGEIILVIFPDGTGPALLSCMIAGIPYNEVHALEFKPGELRLDISRESIRELYEARKDDPAYLATIEEGKEKLKELRSMTAQDFSVSFKDSQGSEKLDEESAANLEKQKAAAAEKAKEAEERREAIQEQLRLSRDAKNQAQLEIKEKKEQKLRENRELASKKREEQQALYVEKKKQQEKANTAAKQKYAESQEASKRKLAESQEAAKQRQLDATENAIRKQAETKQKYEELATARKQKDLESQEEGSSDMSIFGMSPAVLATAAVGAIGAAFLGGDEAEDEKSGTVATTTGGSGGGASVAANATSIASNTPSVAAFVKKETVKIQTPSPVTSHNGIEQLHSVASAKKNITETAAYLSSVQKGTPNVTTATAVTSTKKEEQKENPKSAATASSAPAPNPKVAVKKPSTVKVTNAKNKNEGYRKRKKPKLILHSMRKTDETVAKEAPAKKPPSAAPVLKQKPKPMPEPAASTDWRKGRKKPILNGMRSQKDDATAPVSAAATNGQDEFGTKLQAAEQDMKNALAEAADVKKKKQQQNLHQQHPNMSTQHQQPPKKKSSLFANDAPVIVTKAPAKSTNYVYEDDVDDSDWLRVLTEIRDEGEDNDDEDDFGMVDYTSIASSADL